MQVLFILFLVICAGVALSQQGNTTDGSPDVIFTIEHRLHDDRFTHRTKIHLVKKSDGKQALVYPERNGIFGEDIRAFKGKLDSNSLYTIRIWSQYGNYSSQPVLSSIPACELQKSGFKEDITVYLDQKQGVVGVAYTVPTSTVARECDSSKLKDAAAFQTKIKLGDSVPIQWVPVKAVGARPANMKDVKLGPEDKTAKPERKTFLQQYWYIVVFMVLYMFMGRAAPEAAPAAGSAGAAAAAGAAPAAAK